MLNLENDDVEVKDNNNRLTWKGRERLDATTDTLKNMERMNLDRIKSLHGNIRFI